MVAREKVTKSERQNFHRLITIEFIIYMYIFIFKYYYTLNLSYQALILYCIANRYAYFCFLLLFYWSSHIVITFLLHLKWKQILQCLFLWWWQLNFAGNVAKRRSPSECMLLRLTCLHSSESNYHFVQECDLNVSTGGEIKLCRPCS